MKNKKKKKILKEFRSQWDNIKKIRKLTEKIEKIIKSEKSYNRKKFKDNC